MTVILPLSQFEATFPIEKLSLNDRQCRGVFVDDQPRETYIVFNITDSLASCGTNIKSNETHIIYSNAIRDNDITDTASYVTRSSIEIWFHCAFPTDIRVKMIDKIEPTVRTVSTQKCIKTLFLKQITKLFMSRRIWI